MATSKGHSFPTKPKSSYNKRAWGKMINFKIHTKTINENENPRCYGLGTVSGKIM
jgi:hypothetical protein